MGATATTITNPMFYHSILPPHQGQADVYTDVGKGEKPAKRYQFITEKNILLKTDKAFGLELATEEDRTVWVELIQPQTVLRFDWWQGEYYEIEVTENLLQKIIVNFGDESNEIAWNLDHIWWNDMAMVGRSYGWTKALRYQGEVISGETEFMTDSAQWIRDGLYKYVSVELGYLDAEEANSNGQPSLLTGVALTNRPAIRNLKEIGLSLADTYKTMHRTSVVKPEAEMKREGETKTETETGGEKMNTADSNGQYVYTEEEHKILMERIVAAEKASFDLTLKNAFEEHLEAGRVTPAEVEEYKADIEAFATPNKALALALKIVANIKEGSAVDLSEQQSVDTKDDTEELSADEDSKERDDFVDNRIRELVAEGETENAATVKASMEWDAKVVKQKEDK